MNEEFMTTQQAAEILGIDRASISRLIRQGKLTGERFGHAWMVSTKSVEDFKEKTEGLSKFDRTRGKVKKN